MKHYQYLVEEESIGLQCFQRKLIPNFILSDIIGGKILWKLYLFCCKRKDIGCQNQSLCPSGEIDIIAIKYWTVSPLRMRAPEKEWTFYKVGRMYCKYWTVWPLRMRARGKEWTFDKVGRMYCKYWTVWPLRNRMRTGEKNEHWIKLVGSIVYCILVCSNKKGTKGHLPYSVNCEKSERLGRFEIHLKNN